MATEIEKTSQGTAKKKGHPSELINIIIQHLYLSYSIRIYVSSIFYTKTKIVLYKLECAWLEYAWREGKSVQNPNSYLERKETAMII